MRPNASCITGAATLHLYLHMLQGSLRKMPHMGPVMDEMWAVKRAVKDGRRVWMCDGGDEGCNDQSSEDHDQGNEGWLSEVSKLIRGAGTEYVV